MVTETERARQQARAAPAIENKKPARSMAVNQVGDWRNRFIESPDPRNLADVGFWLRNIGLIDHFRQYVGGTLQYLDPGPRPGQVFDFEFADTSLSSVPVS
jgi:hypothetical protein